MPAQTCAKDAPWAPPPPDADGHVFLDRNPEYFKYALDYLRANHILLPRPPTEPAAMLAIKAEADSFGRQGLVQICDRIERERSSSPKNK